ncbi:MULTISPECIES: YusW family protein [Vagococcus]|uniref:MucBP domain-containing protein n=1 Tax=Vagococcus fluvialis bH819 TaxID=1255619 RepID=A0A1X6WLL6_9ENTE|nr:MULTISPECIES: YusW family protein [Vagococcus]SLM85233.1 hypothetical protein FM121_03980 [Vagococcus fluvialis bH819]HCM88353.1 hypothetical protein [Vagococcus sp.]
MRWVKKVCSVRRVLISIIVAVSIIYISANNVLAGENLEILPSSNQEKSVSKKNNLQKFNKGMLENKGEVVKPTISSKDINFKNWQNDSIVKLHDLSLSRDDSFEFTEAEQLDNGGYQRQNSLIEKVTMITKKDTIPQFKSKYMTVSMVPVDQKKADNSIIYNYNDFETIKDDVVFSFQGNFTKLPPKIDGKYEGIILPLENQLDKESVTSGYVISYSDDSSDNNTIQSDLDIENGTSIISKATYLSNKKKGIPRDYQIKYQSDSQIIQPQLVKSVYKDLDDPNGLELSISEKKGYDSKIDDMVEIPAKDIEGYNFDHYEYVEEDTNESFSSTEKKWHGKMTDKKRAVIFYYKKKSNISPSLKNIQTLNNLVLQQAVLDSRESNISLFSANTPIKLNIKQEVLGENNSFVIPSTGSIELKNTNSSGSHVDSKSNLVVPSYKADSGGDFKQVMLLPTTGFPNYLPNVFIPEFYNYDGYQLTSTNMKHKAENRKVENVENIDSTKSEYWLTVYINQKANIRDAPLYNWDYKVNDFGKIKVTSNLHNVEGVIEFSNGREIKYKYEIESSGKVKAEFEDSRTGKKSPEESQRIIEEMFEGLDVKNSTQKQIIDHLLNSLGLPKKYDKFEIKAEFKDGTEIKFSKG